MKKMTCDQMGGPCEADIMGSTPEEMIANGMKHMEEAHPEMAEKIKATPKDDPTMVEWGKKFAADFEAAPVVS